MFLEMTIQGKQWLKLINFTASIFKDKFNQTKIINENACNELSV